MLIDPQQLYIFIPIALALNLTPGADMLFCLSQGLSSGPRAGVAASLGIATGSLIHSLLAGLGLAALIAANPIAFEIIRWTGIAYLLWLGLRALRTPVQTLSASRLSPVSPLKAWRDGIIVNLFNPKIALFMLALVPQFVDPERGSTVLQFLIFGLILNFGTVFNALVGAFAGSFGRALATNQLMARIFQYITGLIFFALAARLIFERR